MQGGGGEEWVQQRKCILVKGLISFFNPKEFHLSSHQPQSRSVLCWSSLGSVRINLLKTVLDGSATLCEICKPCAKLRLVQTTGEGKNLPSACRASPAWFVLCLTPGSLFFPAALIKAWWRQWRPNWLQSRICYSPYCWAAEHLFQIPPKDTQPEGWFPECFWCWALEDSLYVSLWEWKQMQ